MGDSQNEELLVSAESNAIFDSMGTIEQEGSPSPLKYDENANSILSEKGPMSMKDFEHPQDSEEEYIVQDTTNLHKDILDDVKTSPDEDKPNEVEGEANPGDDIPNEGDDQHIDNDDAMEKDPSEVGDVAMDDDDDEVDVKDLTTNLFDPIMEIQAADMCLKRVLSIPFEDITDKMTIDEAQEYAETIVCDMEEDLVQFFKYYGVIRETPQGPHRIFI